MTTTSLPPVIGLLGLARSGKDTFASRLVDTHGWQRLAFADELKRAALALNPDVAVYADEAGMLSPGTFGQWPGHWPLAQVVSLVGWERAKELRQVRGTLQRLGVAMREVDPGVWVKPVAARLYTRTTPVVITDVRFPNEVGMIRHLGGRLIRTVRTGQAAGSHISETSLLDILTDWQVSAPAGNVEPLLRAADYVATHSFPWHPGPTL